jgi:hypothetical protein
MSLRRLSSHHAKVVGRLHDELTSCKSSDDEACDPGSGPETLYKRVARAKARWLRRVMYGTIATSTEKCFAYAVAEHLNCVTLDAWPGKTRLAQLLGFKSVKTIQRGARGLEALSVLVVKCHGRSLFRYAPVFLPGDEDKNVPKAGQTWPTMRDTNVRESLLVIHINSSIPSKREFDGNNSDQLGQHRYRSSERGAIEVKIAAMLGSDGMEVLFRLGAVDDAIIERLCRAHATGALGERELIAARLAAEQLR